MARIRITVLEGGLQTTLQDQGRESGKAYGVPPGGALDQTASRLANRLVYNRAGAATLELLLSGPRLLFETPALIALTGADFRPLLDGRPVPNWLSVFVRAGQVLEFSRPAPAAKKGEPPGKKNWGRAAYLAVHGGFEAPLFLGSRATYLKAGLSGYRGLGRPLAPGDELTSSNEALAPVKQFPEGAGRALPENLRPGYNSSVELRLVRGPFQENFSEQGYATLFSLAFTLQEDSDRMGFRLQGPPLQHRGPEYAEIAACGTVLGSIQVPSNGQPIVLMADHQVTGGYPVIGVVYEEDLPLLAQLLPGGEVRFKE